MMSTILDALNPWRWLILAGLCAALWAGHTYRVHQAEKTAYAEGDKAGAQRVQVQYDAFKGEMITRTQTLLAASYQVGGLMLHSFTTRAQELTHEIDTITAERDALSKRLHNRPQRPAAVGTGSGSHVPSDPTHAAAAAGCTGAQLYQQDGLFLVGEAARGEMIRAGLLKCYADLDEARQRWADFNAAHAPGAP